VSIAIRSSRSLIRIAAALLILTSYAASIRASTLSGLWKELIVKYPSPTRVERDTLARAYKNLVGSRFANAANGEKPDGPAKVENTRIDKCKLKAYAGSIRRASTRFDVPEAVIAAVIVQESGGNPRAGAKTSSAKGLMQTIDATFALAILSGTWNLSYVFELARRDYPGDNDRKDIRYWKKALEYYYAGPVWGKESAPVVHARVGGKTLVIRKAWYAERVLRRAGGFQG